VADIYEALTADRPYRAGMERGQALQIIHRERGTKLCMNAVDGLEAAVDELDAWRAQSAHAPIPR
jgi:HD-GYP domain-containing protein (c-di-GMP phosphodiesterase class II)